MLDTQISNNNIKLLTIGYEGADLGDFIETLKFASVFSLIDVRELPLSRKKGFSKNALKEAVEAAGISYIHVRQLGDPKPGRDAAKSGDLNTFRRIFSAHMQKHETREALDSLVPVVSEGGACLLCFERCHTDCHRSIVADELCKLAAIQLCHIGVRRGIAART